MAPSAERPRVAAEEIGSFVGGLLIGMAGAALVIALLPIAAPAGIVILGSLVGSVGGGYLGGYLGGLTGKAIYDAKGDAKDEMRFIDAGPKY
jgi:phage tail tape-measure protein